MNITFLQALQAAADRRITLRPHPTVPGYVIANYTPETAFKRDWDEVTLACRGLMFDGDGLIVGRGFNKFFNEGEPGAPELSTFSYFECYPKMDGSLGISYHLPDGSLAWATRGSFDSPQAEFANRWWAEHGQGIQVPLGRSLVAEIIYPENRIVVDYGQKRDLVLLGCVDHATGKVFSPRDTALYYGWRGGVCDRVDPEDVADLSGVEGYVYREVGVPGVPKQIKVKTPWYLTLHRAISGFGLKPVADAYFEGRAEQFIADLPDELHAEAKRLAASVASAAARIEGAVHDMYFRFPQRNDRKALALHFKSTPYLAAVMALFENNQDKFNRAIERLVRADMGID